MRLSLTATLVAGLLVVASAAHAQPARPAPPSSPARPAVPAAPQQSSPAMGMLADAPDARETRDRLNEVLSQYPPSVREVLRIDPTLMYRPDYLATYPMLAAFLEQHPQVAHNPGFFVGEWRHEEQNNPRLEAIRAIRGFGEFVGIISIGIVFTTGVVLLVRTFAEHRRWQRATKLQSDLNAKLIDRFASNADLLAYLESPQGRQLTEPLALPMRAARGVDAPLNRIFLSAQVGAVLLCGGIGILVARPNLTGDLGPDGAAFLSFIGILVLMIGVGFILSSVVSFILSRRLGLIGARTGGEAPSS